MRGCHTTSSGLDRYEGGADGGVGDAPEQSNARLPQRLDHPPRHPRRDGAGVDQNRLDGVASYDVVMAMVRNGIKAYQGSAKKRTVTKLVLLT